MASVEAEFVSQCACPGCRAWVPEVNAQRLCQHCATSCTVQTVQGPMLASLDRIMAAHPSAQRQVRELPPISPQAVQFARKLAVQKWGARTVAKAERNVRQAAEGFELVAEVIRAIQRGRGRLP